jgi:hypothetical protein
MKTLAYRYMICERGYHRGLHRRLDPVLVVGLHVDRGAAEHVEESGWSAIPTSRFS